MFKKKSLKFTYEKVSRDLRHAETFKARETSRFKRLSMIRSINDSDLISMETQKEKNFKEPEKKKPSRLEMLFKWKQEKQLKKEMEKLQKKQPFVVGGKKIGIENKASQNFKSSFLSQTNSSFNSSKFVKSKLVTPSSTVQSSKIQKQGIPNSSVQSSRVPSSKQGTTGTFQLSRNLTSKQGSLTTSQSSRIPNSKQAPSSLPKFGSNLSRSNSTVTLPRKIPTSSYDKAGCLAKPGNSLSRSNSTATISKKFPVSSSVINKAGSLKIASSEKVTPVNRVLNNVSSGNKSNPKPVNKGMMQPKSGTKFQEEKSAKKPGMGLPKLTSDAIAISKANPIQNKIPLSNINKKFGSNPKLNFKEVSQSKEGIASRKGFCFRTAITNSRCQQTGSLLKTPLQGTPKKLQENVSKNATDKPSTKDFSEQSVDGIPDVTFNSDISIIKPDNVGRVSFAPANFVFQPPEGLNNFVFEDEDYDVYQDLEEVKLKFMSRTSTPSRSSGRKSSCESSRDSLGSNKFIEQKGKTTDVSNSNDLRISELMTPESSNVKVDYHKADETLNRQVASNETACDMIKNVEITDGINQQTREKKTDVAANQEIDEKLTSVSPEKSEIQVDYQKADEALNRQVASDMIKNVKITDDINQQTCEKETNVVANQETDEKLTTVSPEKAEIQVHKIVNQESNKEITYTNEDLIKTEIAEEKIEGESQKCLFEGKQLLNDPGVIENPKGNVIEVNNDEKQLYHSLESDECEKTVNDIFLDLDNDDSLLDSIDLNKIKLMNLEDEDTDEDDIPSPQSLKYHETKSNGAVPKRVSMLRKLSVMNSIAESAEINETDDCMSLSPTELSKKNQEIRSTPRHSKRISRHLSVLTPSHTPLKNEQNSPSATPRRSLRLMKISGAVDNLPVSPLKEKNPNAKTRRSMRLIDLNTPEKAVCEKLLGENFENMDPNKFLIDWESPTMPAITKSKKVSLLYSPEKRKSIRKSIRGDLISFSPV